MLEQQLDELYAAPLDAFTRTRDALARELAKDDRARAEAVRKLKRPSVAAWALNQVARREPAAVRRFLERAKALHDAQLAGSDELRGALAAERQSATAVLEHAKAVLAEERGSVTE